jgi:hypothetical protein
MRRVADWETALHSFLEAKRGEGHAYGRHDCLLFVGGAVLALTGEDLICQHLGRYRTERGAARYLRQLGAETPEQYLDRLLDALPVGFAGRGDIVLCDGIPGLCAGAEALFVPLEGAEYVAEPRSRWTKAWAVGERA